MEIDLNQNLTGQADLVQFYINITTDLSRGDNNTVKQVTLDPLFRVQDIRYSNNNNNNNNNDRDTYTQLMPRTCVR